MKIEFKNDAERNALIHILSEWFIHNNDLDVLGCEPACRDEFSPGCDHCIQRAIERQLEDDTFSFHMFGGEEWIMDCTVKQGAEPKGY